MERRYFDFVEVRSADDGQPELYGYAAVVDVESADLGGFTEVIEPGAFSDTLAAGADVKANINHRGGLATLGRTTSGTLTLWEDDKGLGFRLRPADTSAGRDITELVKRGDIDEMSFAFRIPEGGERWVRSGEQVQRRLRVVNLDKGDVSFVDDPAYPQTSAEARARMNIPTIPADVLGRTPDADADNEPDDEKAKAQARNANRKRRLTLELLKGDT